MRGFTSSGRYGQGCRLVMPLLLAGFASLLVAACSSSTTQAATAAAQSPPPAASPAAPKAYIGLFDDNAVAVLDTADNQVLSAISVPTGPHGLAITPDGRTLLVAVFGDGQVAMVDTSTNTVTGRVPVANPHNIAITPDGQTAYVASQQPDAPALTILDIVGQPETGRVPLTRVPRPLSFSRDGPALFFTQAGVDTVQMLDPTAKTVTAMIPAGPSPHYPLITAHGEYGLAVSQGTGELVTFDPKDGTGTGAIKVDTQPHWIAAPPTATPPTSRMKVPMMCRS